MISFLIQDDDLVFDGQGNLLMVERKEEEAQSIERLLTTRVNEFFLNPAMGFDYSVLDAKSPDYNAIRLALIECITQDKRVLSVTGITFNLDNETRQLSVNFNFTTNSGTITSEVII